MGVFLPRFSENDDVIQVNETMCVKKAMKGGVHETLECGRALDKPNGIRLNSHRPCDVMKAG